VSATAVPPASALTIGASLAAAAVLVLMPAVAILSVLVGHRTCAGAAVEPSPTTAAERGIPGGYLTLYRHAGRQYAVPWPVLAGIGSIETDHGRSRAPGVRSGVNSYGCCAGPMQFNLRDGPPSTWDRYGIDGNRDGARDIYDPADAIASAANYLRTLLRNANGDLAQAVFGYNHSQAYVDDVLARARAYARGADGGRGVDADDPSFMAACAGGGVDVPVGPASLGIAERVSSPRAYRTLPASAMAPGRAAQVVDARIHNDVVWMLRRYRLRVTAAREAGHRTHGDGTAVDLIPADGTTQAVWDGSAGRLAHDLGWSPACARAGTRPVCRLAPALQFVGYDGYPGHGSPRTCTDNCAAHLHISWASPCYGTSGLTPPCEWVMSFPARHWAMPDPGKHART
jgi:transglycosylase-like protein with SLT domain